MNSVLNMLKKLKRTYEERIGSCTYEYQVKRNRTCVNRWVEDLNDPYWTAVFSGLSLWQYENYVNFHYNGYYFARNEKGETLPYRDFFSVYEGLYRECRGVVLDVKTEKVILCPFQKFWNLDEVPETRREVIVERLKKAKTIEFSDKMDGSMISVGVDSDQGRIVFSGSYCNNPKESFLLRQAEKYLRKEIQTMVQDHPEETHIFEFLDPTYDAHVVSYPVEKTGLYLVGIRNRETGKELSYREVIDRADQYQVRHTVLFSKTLEEVLKELDSKLASEAEGFVLNVDGLKVKIKYSDYCSVFRIVINSNIHPKASINQVIQAMEDGTFDDLYAKTPDAYKERLSGYRDQVLSLVQKLNERVCSYYQKVRDLPKKEAMLQINGEVPKKYRGLVMDAYLENPSHYLKNKSGHYRTISEMEDLVKE